MDDTVGAGDGESAKDPVADTSAQASASDGTAITLRMIRSSTYLNFL